MDVVVRVEKRPLLPDRIADACKNVRFMVQ